MNPQQREQIAARTKAFLFDLLQDNPSVSLGELQGVLLDVAGAGRSAAATAPAKRARSSGKASFSAQPGAVNTRTRAGREVYQEAVHAAMKKLGGKQLSSRQVRGEAGGSPNQFRAAIDSLIESKKVLYEGQKAGTRYSLR